MVSFEAAAAAAEIKLQNKGNEEAKRKVAQQSQRHELDGQDTGERACGSRGESSGEDARINGPKAHTIEPLLLPKMILEAYDKKRYNECLQLKPVYRNALGRPVWEVSMEEITGAYKKLAVLIHPDKNVELKEKGQQANAVEAFKALHGAYRALKDRKEREAMIQRLGEKAPLLPGLDNGSTKLKQKLQLKQEEVTGFADEIKRQIQEKKRKAEEKKAKQERSNYSNLVRSDKRKESLDDDAEGLDGFDGSYPSPHATKKSVLLKKRRKNVFF